MIIATISVAIQLPFSLYPSLLLLHMHVIGRVVVVVVIHIKIARSRLLGVSASLQYCHDVEYAKKC